MPWQWSNRSKARRSRQEHQEQATEGIAFELYQNRLLLGKPGDQDSDWEEARQIISNPIKTALFASNRLLIKLRKPTAKVRKFIARDTPEWLIFSLPKLEWMKLLAVPLAITLAGSVISRQVQREANQNSALKSYFDQLEKLTFDRELLTNSPKSGAIPLARGRTVAALRELDYERRKQLIAFLQASELTKVKEDGKEPVISFRRQDLSRLDLHSINLNQTDFQEADLNEANLRRANLSNAKLKGANLAAAKLEEANLAAAELEKVNLNNANLEGANLSSVILKKTTLSNSNLKNSFLSEANLEGAILIKANLDSGDLTNANLKNSNLSKANLKAANLDDSDLEGVDLIGTNLEKASLNYANLEGANLTGANLSEANLSEAKGLTKEQLELKEMSPYLCQTQLPEEIRIDPNRDCDALGIYTKNKKLTFIFYIPQVAFGF
jgi:uncharacterized protein YjbI with pentapeptide repeats